MRLRIRSLGHIWLRVLLPAALVALAAAGCTHDVPVLPGRTVAYVPRPEAVDPGLPAEEVEAQYTVFPNRNPDGLGVLDTVWSNSTMTLMVWEIEAAREERNRIAYARSAEEQAAVVARRKAFYDGHVVIRGRLLARHEEFVDPDSYRPEGIYVLDDRGRRFRPLSVNEGVDRYDRDFRLERRIGGRVSVDVQEAIAGYVYLVFPAEALGPQTRALTLYFAALEKRMSFTWVFDPDYVPGQQAELPGEGKALNRLFPDRTAPRY